MVKLKIVVAGIGGVGGYFGGLLAKHYYNNEKAEVTFIARGEHLSEIQKNGLTVIQGTTKFTANPHKAVSNASEAGIADLILVCTKSFDLQSVIEQLKPCINKDTVLLPLLNGVDSREKIEKMLPENVVLDGCVYIVSRLKQPGVVENAGNIQKLIFGPGNKITGSIERFKMLFEEAGIETTLSNSISSDMWEKYVFISPTATATSAFDKSIGQILSDEFCFATLQALIEEVKLIARAKKIELPDNITESTIAKLKKLPFEATSSLHSDIKAGKSKNEMLSLIGYVTDEGSKLGIDTPTYSQLYSQLSAKLYEHERQR